MTLEAALERLGAAAGAATQIGLTDEADGATRVHDAALQRAGFPGSAYVLALAGGTGVGKSSLLNALAGRTVSAVRAVRPTTDAPVGWVAEERLEEVAGLLEWLGVQNIATHADEALGGVVIVDLPDVDSVRLEHRARVDALLPRLDAVAWVVDPEKYDDARLHGYLRDVVPHADRMRFVLNKTDRLTDAQCVEVVNDFRERLATAGIDEARIDAVSSHSGAGIDALRQDLGGLADAKALVTAKLVTDATEATSRLARAVGLDRDGRYRPLLDPRRREEARAEAVSGALALVDPSGLARQMQAAVLGRARRSGGSLLGRVVGLLGWITGQSRRRADPTGYLRDWRRRGSLGRAVNPVQAALVEASSRLPAATRPAAVRTLQPEALEESLSRALDGVARDAAADLLVPGSVLWPIVGVVQLIIGAVFAFAVAWYVTLIVASGQVPVATTEVPLLGPVPLPLLLLAGSILVSAVLGLLLSIHAGWIGRRRGRRVAERVRIAVGEAVAAAGFASLDRFEAARRTIGGMT